MISSTEKVFEKLSQKISFRKEFKRKHGLEKANIRHHIHE